MKLILKKKNLKEPVLTIEYDQVTEELKSIISFICKNDKIEVLKGNEKTLVSVQNVIYFEALDKKVFACFDREVSEALMTLAEIDKSFARLGFVRVSKSVVLNIYKIESLKSLDYGRILAMLETGEKIIVSRFYSKILKNSLLQGE